MFLSCSICHYVFLCAMQKMLHTLVQLLHSLYVTKQISAMILSCAKEVWLGGAVVRSRTGDSKVIGSIPTRTAVE